MRSVRIDDNIYYRRIFLVMDVTAQSFARYSKKHLGASRQWAGVAGLTTWHDDADGYTTYYVFLASSEVTPENLAVLGHEVFHLTMAAVTAAGMKYALASEEAFTYYFERVYCQCVKKMMEHAQRRKAKAEKCASC